MDYRENAVTELSKTIRGLLELRARLQKRVIALDLLLETEEDEESEQAQEIITALNDDRYIAARVGAMLEDLTDIREELDTLLTDPIR